MTTQDPAVNAGNTLGHRVRRAFAGFWERLKRGVSHASIGSALRVATALIWASVLMVAGVPLTIAIVERDGEQGNSVAEKYAHRLTALEPCLGDSCAGVRRAILYYSVALGPGVADKVSNSLCGHQMGHVRSDDFRLYLVAEPAPAPGNVQDNRPPDRPAVTKKAPLESTGPRDSPHAERFQSHVACLVIHHSWRASQQREAGIGSGLIDTGRRSLTCLVSQNCLMAQSQGLLTFLMVIVMGGIGGVAVLFRGILGIGDFSVKNSPEKRVSESLSWHLLRPIQGMLMAFIVYMGARAGLLVLGGNTGSALNPYAAAFLGIIAGVVSTDAFGAITRWGKNYFKRDRDSEKKNDQAGDGRPAAANAPTTPNPNPPPLPNQSATPAAGTA